MERPINVTVVEESPFQYAIRMHILDREFHLLYGTNHSVLERLAKDLQSDIDKAIALHHNRTVDVSKVMTA